MSNFIFKSIKSDLALGISLLVFFFLTTLSVYLRPIADDYCVASIATSGLFNHFQLITTTWSGDYIQIFFSYFLVASPIAFGPNFLVGLLTLLLSVFLLILAVAGILHFVLPEVCFEINKRVFIILSALLLMGWVIYWALPASLNTFGEYKSFLSAPEGFSAVFGWPTAIVQYLVVPLLLSILAMRLQKIGAIWTISYAVLGLAIGTAGYAMALAVFVAVPIFILRKTFILKPMRFVLLEVGILIGVYLSFYSQGAQNRTAQIFESESNGNNVSLSRSIFVSFVELLVAILNLGTITVFLLVFLFITLLPHRQVVLKSTFKLNRFVASFTIFLIIYYLVISASEYFTYPAFWHLITFKMLLFIYIVLLAIILATQGQRNYSVRLVRARRGSLVLLLLSLIAIGASTPPIKSIQDRGSLWEEQSAPLPGISDISPKGGWVDSCWVSLREFRGWEERRYDPV